MIVALTVTLVASFVLAAGGPGPGALGTPAGASTATATTAAGPDKAARRPAKWDTRIVALVTFVEKHRKLRFDHPIPVEFLDDAAFRKRVETDDSKVTKADRRDAKRYGEELRALGLIKGQVDILGASSDLAGADTLGYYDQDRKKMVIRGQDLKATDVRVTVVHELTHALQDQHFDLNKLSGKAKTSGEDNALTALVEGDATRIENQYLDTLPKTEQDAYYADLDQEIAANTPGVAGTDLAEVPPILGLLDEVPYDLGTPFVDVVAAEGGSKAIDAAFRHPPTSDQQIIDPAAYFAHRDPQRVPPPTLDAGDTRVGKADDFGAFSLFVLLSARLSFADALERGRGVGWRQLADPEPRRHDVRAHRVPGPGRRAHAVPGRAAARVGGGRSGERRDGRGPRRRHPADGVRQRDGDRTAVRRHLLEREPPGHPERADPPGHHCQIPARARHLPGRQGRQRHPDRPPHHQAGAHRRRGVVGLEADRRVHGGLQARMNAVPSRRR